MKNLEKKIDELEKYIEESNQREEALKVQIDEYLETIKVLQINEKKYKTFFEKANDLIIYLDTDGTIKEMNHLIEGSGHKKETFIGRKADELEYLSKEQMQRNSEFLRDLSVNKYAVMPEMEVMQKDGTITYMEINYNLIETDGEVHGILCIVRDITRRKLTEMVLKKHRDHLEEMVKERTANLEEANSALKVMLQKENELKIELEEKILFNVKELIGPYLEKMKKTKLSNTQMTYMDIIESNLNNITSPFMRGVNLKFMNLTHSEIQVANLIKQGKTTKEIADLLNLSHKTIESHRKNIRRKIGIKNQKVNLRTHLTSMQ